MRMAPCTVSSQPGAAAHAASAWAQQGVRGQRRTPAATQECSSSSASAGSGPCCSTSTAISVVCAPIQQFSGQRGQNIGAAVGTVVLVGPEGDDIVVYAAPFTTQRAGGQQRQPWSNLGQITWLSAPALVKPWSNHLAVKQPLYGAAPLPRSASAQLLG